MPPEQGQPVVFSQRIGAISLSQVADALSHDVNRAKIKTMIDDYCGQVTFEELVMKYAGKEIDKRSLGTFRFWAITVLTTIVTAIITAVVTIFVHG